MNYRIDQSSRLNIILKFVLSFLVFIAAIIIGLALLIFMLSLQLMISRSAEKIRRLNMIGLHPLEISRPYILALLFLLTIVTSISLIISAVISGQLTHTALNWNLEMESGLSGIIYLVAFGLIALLFLLNALSIILSTRRLCRHGD